MSLPKLPSSLVDKIKLILDAGIDVLQIQDLQSLCQSNMTSMRLNELGYCRAARIPSLTHFQSFLHSNISDEANELLIVQQTLLMKYGTKYDVQIATLDHPTPETAIELLEQVLSRVKVPKPNESLVFENTEEIKRRLIKMREVMGFNQYSHLAKLLEVPPTSLGNVFRTQKQATEVQIRAYMMFEKLRFLVELPQSMAGFNNEQTQTNSTSFHRVPTLDLNNNEIEQDIISKVLEVLQSTALDLDFESSQTDWTHPGKDVITFNDNQVIPFLQELIQQIDLCLRNAIKVYDNRQELMHKLNKLQRIFHLNNRQVAQLLGVTDSSLSNYKHQVYNTSVKVATASFIFFEKLRLALDAPKSRTRLMNERNFPQGLKMT